MATRFDPFHVTRALVESPAVLSPMVPDVVMVPPVRPLFVAIEVTVPEFCVRQLPLIAKHPAVRLSPFDAVDVAVVPVRLRYVAEIPFANVDVPCPAPTVMAPANVDVAEVEVATKLLAVIVPYDVSAPLKSPVPATPRVVPGVVVPIPKFPAIYAFPVVVAPPDIVRPPA